MEFIEASIFTKLVDTYLTLEEYTALQWALVANPSIGTIIKGSGGLRKMRWSAKGKGKRGGIRIIYYWSMKQNQIWLLTLYAKGEAEDIPASLLKLLKKEIES